MICSELKDKIIRQTTDIFQRKLLIVNDELTHLSDAIAEDTKSSAGDKYETSREMAALEKEKLNAQAQGFKNALASLGALPQNTSSKIGIGSLIQTDQAWIHLSVSLGQLNIDGETVLVISPLAPLARLLLDNAQGESAVFRDKKYQIINIC